MLHIKWQTLDKETAMEEDVQQAVALATLPSPQVLLKNAVSDDWHRHYEERTPQAYLLRLAEVARLAEEKDLSHVLDEMSLRCQRQEKDETKDIGREMDPYQPFLDSFFFHSSSHYHHSFAHAATLLRYLLGMAEPMHSTIRLMVKQLKAPLLCERSARDEETKSLSSAPFELSSIRSEPMPLHLHRASNQLAKQCLQSLSPCRLKPGRERRRGCRRKEAAQLRTH